MKHFVRGTVAQKVTKTEICSLFDLVSFNGKSQKFKLKTQFVFN